MEMSVENEEHFKEPQQSGITHEPLAVITQHDQERGARRKHRQLEVSESLPKRHQKGVLCLRGRGEK